MAKKNKSRTKAKEQFEYDPPFESEDIPEKPRPKYKTVMVYLIDQDEVNRLIEASNSEYVEPPRPPQDYNYSTYTEEECLALQNCDYYPRRFKKKK